MKKLLGEAIGRAQARQEEAKKTGRINKYAAGTEASLKLRLEQLNGFLGLPVVRAGARVAAVEQVQSKLDKIQYYRPGIGITAQKFASFVSKRLAGYEITPQALQDAANRSVDDFLTAYKEGYPADQRQLLVAQIPAITDAAF